MHSIALGTNFIGMSNKWEYLSMHSERLLSPTKYKIPIAKLQMNFFARFSAKILLKMHVFFSFGFSHKLNDLIVALQPWLGHRSWHSSNRRLAIITKTAYKSSSTPIDSNAFIHARESQNTYTNSHWSININWFCASWHRWQLFITFVYDICRCCILASQLWLENIIMWLDINYSLSSCDTLLSYPQIILLTMIYSCCILVRL